MTSLVMTSPAVASRESEPAGSSGFEVASDAWRRACRAVLKLHRSIADLMAEGGLLYDADVERETLLLLNGAAGGEWPCVNWSGDLDVPGWAERRSERRYRVEGAVTVACDGVAHEGRLIDISHHGVMVAISIAMRAGSTVTVCLPDGRRAAGQVAWARGGHAGIRLQTPLDVERLLGVTKPSR